MGSVPVLLNRGGGAVSADDGIAGKVAAAFKSAGLDVDVQLIDGGDCEVRARAVAERGDPLLIVGGGDGTISAAASALVGTDTKLGLLPLGTLNHFAKDLGIPAAIEEAARTIKAGREIRVDVAEMNDRVFINNSAIGLYPLMVVDRDVQQSRLGRAKPLALTVAVVRTLWRFRNQRLTLTADDEKARIDTPLLFVGNNRYRLDLGSPGGRDRIDRGELFVLAMRKRTRRGFVAASVRALLGRSLSEDMMTVENVHRLRVVSRRTMVPVSLDGEVVMAQSPLEYRIRPKALRVIVP